MTSDNGELPRSTNRLSANQEVAEAELYIMELLTTLSHNTRMKLDGRLLSIARTQIELGFLAINAAVAKSVGI